MTKPKSSVELSVLLVNYNDRKNLGQCLSSVRENISGTSYEIIVVDNNSSDGSQKFIREQFSDVRLICNSHNAGFAAANNLGIRECRGDYLLLLNTDTVVMPQAVEIMLNAMKSDQSLGAVGPALLTERNGFQVSFGRKVSFFRELLQKAVLNAFFKIRLKTDHRVRQVGWLSAACFCVRARIMKEVGCFDENFFLYFEDIDLCARIKSKGYNLLFHPKARVLHLGGATTAGNRLLNRYHYRKSQLYFYWKHNSKTDLFLLRTYLWVNFRLVLGWGNLIQSPDREERRKFIRLLKET
ncbi:MAG: glycosyltransferase family 2 protein [Candidatus Aminicenantes bacterium]|nr:glycosyltransferase family 2 protein [Candidatus Aminicenantes bacterium]